MNRWKNFTSGFVRENPVFGLYLGICSVLAVSTTINNAIGMGVCVIITLLFSNVIISLMRNIIPNDIRIPVYIVIIASLVTVVEMLVNAFSPELAESLGTFISLIVVNCIILGRAEAFASKNGIVDSILDALGMGLGYTVGLLIMAVIRQLIGTGVLEFVNPFNAAQVIFSFTIIPSDYTIGLFSSAPGAFLTFGLLAGLLAMYNGKKQEKIEAAEKAAKAAAAKAAAEAKLKEAK